MIAPSTTTLSRKWTGSKNKPDTTPQKVGEQCIVVSQNGEHSKAIQAVSAKLRHGLADNKDSKLLYFVGLAKLPGYNQGKYEYIKAVLAHIQTDLGLSTSIYPLINRILPKEFILDTYITGISTAIVEAVASKPKPSTQQSTRSSESGITEHKAGSPNSSTRQLFGGIGIVEVTLAQPRPTTPQSTHSSESVITEQKAETPSSSKKQPFLGGIDVLGYALTPENDNRTGLSFRQSINQNIDTPEEKEPSRSRSASDNSQESKSDLPVEQAPTRPTQTGIVTYNGKQMTSQAAHLSEKEFQEKQESWFTDAKTLGNAVIEAKKTGTEWEILAAGHKKFGDTLALSPEEKGRIQAKFMDFVVDYAGLK